MNQHTRTWGRRFALWCMTLCLAAGLALADTRIEIIADDWTWEENGTSTFHGTVQADQDVPEAKLILTVETRLEDSGVIQFLAVDEKQLKIRKRGPETEADLAAGVPLSFEGEWNLPEDTDSGIAMAVLRLEIQDSGGAVIGQGALEVGSQTEEQALESASPVRRVDRLILFLGIGAGASWALAILRHFLLNRKKKGTSLHADI